MRPSCRLSKGGEQLKKTVPVPVRLYYITLLTPFYSALFNCREFPELFDQKRNTNCRVFLQSGMVTIQKSRCLDHPGIGNPYT